ncbi:putative MFS-type transporter [Hyphodiscus hymeniophilus]|uniref:MFS-type transporter n=1 Tax=Hyphodiscus hymeniophilus TaxID=353542 RepID=A0A9P7AWI3_9HELO|nr:putative MFS-type transporter [Hyphodiscus hymeniophilus]
MDSANRHGHLDESVIPGTVHLVDLEGTIRAKHASGAQLSDVVLVPAPSSDPDDPLNWSPRRKWLSTASQSMYTLMVGIASAAIYSVLEPISEDTGLTLADLNAGTGYMFLFFGIGSKILQGFVGAPIESLCEISITDIYFAHERGTYMGLYAFMLAGSNFLAPVFAGFINDGQGWKWVQYWCAIFLAIGFVFCFFFMEETNYDREPLEMVSTPADTSGTVTPKEEKVLSTSTDPEKTAAIVDPDSNDDHVAGAVHYTPKSYVQKLALLDKKRDFHLFRMMIRPLLFFSLPSVVYAGFSYGSNLVWFNVLNGTASLILSAAPYNFSSSMVGLSYVSPLIGVACGSFYSGVIGDRVVLWLARRNKGVLESEHRLWLFSASLVLIPGSLILWGVGAAHHVHWFGLIFAMGVIAASNSIGVQLSVSYCIDSYKDLSGEAMVTVIIIRNTMSFAIGYGVTPWVTNMGYQNAFILAAFAGLAQVLTFLAVVKWGKSWRNMTKKRYYKFVKESQNLGVTH